jgi:hypothetical protein
MKLSSFLAFTGILVLIVYGISRTLTASRLVYLIQNAASNNSQLALMVTVSNNQEQSFTQRSLNADVIVNGKVISQISDSTSFAIPGYQVTPQGWVMDLPADQISGGTIQNIRIRGSVNIDGLPMPLDLNYKFI